VVGLPEQWDDSLDEIIGSVPDGIIRGLYSGFHRPGDEYQHLYERALKRKIVLPNTPTQSERAMSFTRWIYLLEDLTAKSWAVESGQQLEKVISGLPWPVFVKGDLKSRKDEGWDACVAVNAAPLRERWRLAQEASPPQPLIVREILSLRRSRDINGFPCGREYRLLLCYNTVISCNYYWARCDPFGEVDQEPLRELALEAQRRLNVPLLAVDVGQLEDNSWKMIEVGDPQYSLYLFTNHLAFWQQFSE
jgi:hypothetical protein